MSFNPAPSPAPPPQITILDILRAVVLATDGERMELLILLAAS